MSHLNEIKRKMDVRNIVKNSGNVTTLSNVLLAPYQIKLIS